jgi:DNA-binding NarL/FixJ family response regulator
MYDCINFLDSFPQTLIRINSSKQKQMATIALVDDHVLLRKGLANLVQNIGHTISFEADNGEDCIEKLEQTKDPDVILMDINMPKKDGFETTLWLKQNRPAIKVLALSMLDNENAIIRMLKNGAKGYVLKECEPSELKAAIDAVITKGFHYSDMVSGRLLHSISKSSDEEETTRTFLNLNEREIQFLKLASTEMTYKEVATRMNLSPRTIDGYRDALFEKLGVRTRVGLVMYAIRQGIVRV